MPSKSLIQYKFMRKMRFSLKNSAKKTDIYKKYVGLYLYFHISRRDAIFSALGVT